jgi:hypothetical protein
VREVVVVAKGTGEREEVVVAKTHTGRAACAVVWTEETSATEEWGQRKRTIDAHDNNEEIVV